MSTPATQSGPDRQFPWSTEDLVRWMGFSVAGVAGIVVAWFLAAGKGSLDPQVGLTALGVAGTIVAAIGNAMWILRGRRAIGDRTEALLAGIDGREWNAVGLLDDAAGPASVGPAMPDELVAGDGLRFFHHRRCALAMGREWSAADRSTHVAAGRQPCTACQP